jgi:hypothetical protein
MRAGATTSAYTNKERALVVLYQSTAYEARKQPPHKSWPVAKTNNGGGSISGGKVAACDAVPSSLIRCNVSLPAVSLKCLQH